MTSTAARQLRNVASRRWPFTSHSFFRPVFVHSDVGHACRRAVPDVHVEDQPSGGIDASSDLRARRRGHDRRSPLLAAPRPDQSRRSACKSFRADHARRCPSCRPCRRLPHWAPRSRSGYRGGRAKGSIPAGAGHAWDAIKLLGSATWLLGRVAAQVLRRGRRGSGPEDVEALRELGASARARPVELVPSVARPR